MKLLNSDYMTLKQTFVTRRQHLKRVCNKYSNPLRSEHGIFNTIVLTERYFGLIKPRFAMCLIPKVASTSLSNFFIQLSLNTTGTYV
jgi:hypothetical protein